eukprot:scaffold38588_cov69-Phaeocystis_antarctica.AAC.2
MHSTHPPSPLSQARSSVGTALGESVRNEGRVATEGALVLDKLLQLGQDLLLLLDDLLAPLARRLLVLVELQRVGHQLRVHHVQRFLLLGQGHLLADQRDLRLWGPGWSKAAKSASLETAARAHEAVAECPLGSIASPGSAEQPGATRRALGRRKGRALRKPEL